MAETSVWRYVREVGALGADQLGVHKLPKSVFYAPPFFPFQENHWQTFAEVYNPAFSHKIMVPTQTLKPMVMNERKIIARRAAMESWGHRSVFHFILFPVGSWEDIGHIGMLPLTYTLQKGLAH